MINWWDSDKDIKWELNNIMTDCFFYESLINLNKYKK